jgi:5-methylcytosine-specific restriction protein A
MREELDAVMTGIAVAARGEPFKGHSLAHRIRHDWPAPVVAFVDDSSYKVEGSPGKGNWADAVWLAVFDRMITESAERGFYVVYLVPADGSRVFLSLNQGTTEIHDRVGRRYREVLQQTATRDGRVAFSSW